MEDVKLKIKYYMAKRNVSPKELSEALQIGTTTLYGYFKHPEMWRVGLLDKAYIYLRVPEDERIVNIK